MYSSEKTVKYNEINRANPFAYYSINKYSEI